MPKHRLGLPRNLDHFVIAVRDLDSAALQYERLGFFVLPRMRHLEIGSCNRIFQLHGTYVELVADLHKATPHVRDRLTPRFVCGDGLAIVSLTADGLSDDHEQLAKEGMGPSDILNARRQVKLPNGTFRETDSSCFYVWRDGRTFGSLFLSEHRRPETIWVPQYMGHKNGAIRVSELIYASNDPAEDVGYFSSLLRAPPVRIARGEVVFETGRHERVVLLAPQQLEERFGCSLSLCPELPAYPAGLVYEVLNLDACRGLLRRQGVTFVDDGKRLQVRAVEASGVVTEFVTSALLPAKSDVAD